MSELSAAVISDPVFADLQLPSDYKGGPSKVLAVDHALRSDHFPFPFSFSGEHRLPAECFIEPVLAEIENLSQVHPIQYVEKLSNLCARLGECSYDAFEPFQFNSSGLPDLCTYVSSRAFEIIRYGIGSIRHAIDLIFEGKYLRVFTVKSYMGHHAEEEKAMGFCIFNSAAEAARYVLEKDPNARVAIVDWDVHFGNGTAKIFESDSRVFYGSIHQNNLFPPRAGSSSERGVDQGIGTTLNIPLEAGTSAAQYGYAFDRLLKAVEDFNPTFIIIECGFDACQGDSIGRLLLQPHHFRVLTSRLVNLSQRVAAKGRILSILAGGYTPQIVGEAAIRHVQALFEPDTDPESLRMR